MNIFKPVIYFMNRLKYTYKFLLIGVLFVILSAALTILVIKEQNDQIALMEERVEGIQFNLVLKNLLKNAQQHRGTSATLHAGDESVRANLSEIKENMELALQQLTELEQSTAYDFNLKDQTTEIRQQWETIVKTDQWTSSEEVVAVHSALSDLIIETMREVTNNSSLQLAESKESNNLIFSLTDTLPQLTEKLGVIRASAMAILKNGTMTDEERRKISQQYYLIEQDFHSMEQNMAVVFQNDEMKKALLEIEEQAFSLSNVYLTEIEKLILSETITQDTAQFYDIATESIDANFDFYDVGLEYMVSLLQDQLEALEREKVIILSIEIIVFLLAILLFSGFYLGVKGSINKLAEATQKVANGDLTVRVNLETHDEMKDIEDAFNSMTENLNILVMQISSSASHVTASSEELHAGVEETTSSIQHVSETIEEVSKGASQQVLGVTESKNALDDMALQVEAIKSKSGEVFDLTKNTTNFAQDGDQAIRQSTKQMEEIEQSVSETGERVRILSERSSEIDRILNMITDIAEQTNLLSLNAAIEAARAGEHGKGFAVVADEVRKLAEQSREATKDVRHLIELIHEDTAASVHLMEQVTENVAKGYTISQTAAEKFHHIVGSTNQLMIEMDGIKSMVEEVATRTEQVTAEMNMMQNISEKNGTMAGEVAAATEQQSASMEEISASATELAKMAESLQQLVYRFTLK